MKSKLPLSDKEKQTQPMPGEVEPKNAYLKAREFARKELAGMEKAKK